MAVLSLIVASLFVVYVTLVRPLLARRRYRKFLREVATNPALRSRYYLRSLGEQWLWMVVIGIILLLGAVTPSTLGLRAPDDWGSTLLIIVEVMVLVPIALLVMIRRIAKMQRPGRARLLLAVKELLPHTAQERRLWLLVSVTAGTCEEIVFRGFLPWYLLTLGAFFQVQVSILVALVLATILFGFAHIYQGWKGVLGTGLIGGVLAYLYVYTGSLVLPMVCHVLIDARIVFLAPVLVKMSERLNAGE